MDVFKIVTEGISNRSKRKEKERQERECIKQENREKDAQNYIEREGIRCDSDMDSETLRLVVDSITEKKEIDINSSISISEGYSYMENSAIKVADANMYQCCKAIIAQNSMLMRKIDALSERLEEIEKRTGQSKE
jgi:hypothetical protein